MTNEEIDALKGGELDWCIDQQIMKSGRHEYEAADDNFCEVCRRHELDKLHTDPPDYCHDIAAAWEVVKKMAERKLTPEIDLRGAGWAVKYIDYTASIAEQIESQHTCIDRSISLAICRAALKKVYELTWPTTAKN